MVVCLDMSVDVEDVDVVFAEYVLNDGMVSDIDNPRSREYERLLRRVLSLPRRPPMVMMQTMSHGVPFPRDKVGRKAFNDGIEDVYGALSRYYDLPWLSLRAATYRLAEFSNNHAFAWTKVMNGADGDFLHPSVSLLLSLLLLLLLLVCTNAAGAWLTHAT